MTPQEFAEAHGLTVEEAELVLAKRHQPALGPNSRLALARARLEEAHRRTGARSVSTQGDKMVEVVPPDTSVEFMKNEPAGPPYSHRVTRALRQEDVSQDPEDY